MNESFFNNLALNIKKNRKRLHLTQQQLADRVGVGLNHIGKVEVGYSKPSIDLIISIATALEVTVSELCDFSEL